MPIQVRKGGVWRQIASAQVFANGAWRSLVAVKVYAGGAWRTVANFTAPSGTFSLSASDSQIFSSGPTSSQTTNTVTVTPSGGLAPYTYSWVFVSRDSNASYSLTNAASAFTAVSATGVPAGATGTASIQCTCTDSTGLTATSAVVVASITNTSGGTN